MDTKAVAEKIGVTPRVLRQFLRSTYSSFVPVGSGARYSFTDREIPTVQKRFNDWVRAGRPRPTVKQSDTPAPTLVEVDDAQRRRDEQIWQEEGPVVLEDIRDPRVRRRALADAKAAENRLMLLLMSKGLHITQQGDGAVRP